MGLKIKRKWVSLTFFFLICFISVYMLIDYFSLKTNTDKLYLRSQFNIIDHSKLTVTPLFENNQITFHFFLESYENSEFLNLNMKEFCIITYQGKLIDPDDWTIVQKNNYNLKATLTAPLYDKNLLYPIKMEFFFDEPLTFIWEKN